MSYSTALANVLTTKPFGANDAKCSTASKSTSEAAEKPNSAALTPNFNKALKITSFSFIFQGCFNAWFPSLNVIS